MLVTDVSSKRVPAGMGVPIPIGKPKSAPVIPALVSLTLGKKVVSCCVVSGGVIVLGTKGVAPSAKKPIG